MARAGLRLYSIGHSTRSMEELVGLLRAHGVTRLVDVRTIPRSRHNPQFDRDAMPGALAAAGIAYEHRPGLGGLRKPRRDGTNAGWRNDAFRGYADYMQTDEFAVNLGGLIDLGRRDTVAFMCAEAVPWRCHRSLIADALVVRGLRVHHITSLTRAEPHRLTPFARVQGDRVTYPAQPARRRSRSGADGDFTGSPPTSDQSELPGLPPRSGTRRTRVATKRRPGSRGRSETRRPSRRPRR